MKGSLTGCLVFGAIAAAYAFAFTLIAISGGLVFIRDIYGPSLKFPHKTGKSKLKKRCKPTTDDLEDLVIDQDAIKNQNRPADILRDHGAAVVKNVLTKETAQQMRDYVLEENKKLLPNKQVFVIEKKHRYNLVPDGSQPIVQKLLKEVGAHPQLRAVIADEIGEDASLVNYSVLTVEYGAEDQFLHMDTDTSVATHPNDFVKEYALVIALQDTTEEMAPTHLCPGTHFCRNVALEDPDDDDEDEDDGQICKVKSTINQGDSFIFSSDLYHRGTGHTDPDAPARAFVFLIFAESRQGPKDNRILPFGEVRVLDWKMWGHTFKEFLTIKEHPWKWWHSFGLFRRNTAVRPWTLFDYFFTMFPEGEGRLHLISNKFDLEYFEEMVNIVLAVSAILLVGVLYMVLLPLLCIGMYYYVNSPASALHQSSGDMKVNGHAKQKKKKVN